MKRVMAYLMRVVGRRTCQDVVAVLLDYCEGSLDPKLAAAIERHFEGCRSCHAFMETYKEVVRLTGELACEDIPDEVRLRVQAALHEQVVRDQ
jgi:anti-sigma factor RsiW